MPDLIQLNDAREHYLPADSTDERQVQVVGSPVVFGDPGFEFGDKATVTLKEGQVRVFDVGRAFRSTGQSSVIATQVPLERESKPPVEYQASVNPEVVGKPKKKGGK